MAEGQVDALVAKLIAGGAVTVTAEALADAFVAEPSQLPVFGARLGAAIRGASTPSAADAGGARAVGADEDGSFLRAKDAHAPGAYLWPYVLRAFELVQRHEGADHSVRHEAETLYRAVEDAKRECATDALMAMQTASLTPGGASDDARKRSEQLADAMELIETLFRRSKEDVGKVHAVLAQLEARVAGGADGAHADAKTWVLAIDGGAPDLSGDYLGIGLGDWQSQLFDIGVAGLELLKSVRVAPSSSGASDVGGGGGAASGVGGASESKGAEAGEAGAGLAASTRAETTVTFLNGDYASEALALGVLPAVFGMQSVLASTAVWNVCTHVVCTFGGGESSPFDSGFVDMCRRHMSNADDSVKSDVLGLRPQGDPDKPTWGPHPDTFFAKQFRATLHFLEGITAVATTRGAPLAAQLDMQATFSYIRMRHLVVAALRTMDDTVTIPGCVEYGGGAGSAGAGSSGGAALEAIEVTVGDVLRAYPQLALLSHASLKLLTSYAEKHEGEDPERVRHTLLQAICAKSPPMGSAETPALVSMPVRTAPGQAPRLVTLSPLPAALAIVFQALWRTPARGAAGEERTRCFSCCCLMPPSGMRDPPTALAACPHVHSLCSPCASFSDDTGESGPRICSCNLGTASDPPVDNDVDVYDLYSDFDEDDDDDDDDEDD